MKLTIKKGMFKRTVIDENGNIVAIIKNRLFAEDKHIIIIQNNLLIKTYIFTDNRLKNKRDLFYQFYATTDEKRIAVGEINNLREGINRSEISILYSGSNYILSYIKKSSFKYKIIKNSEIIGELIVGIFKKNYIECNEDDVILLCIFYLFAQIQMNLYFSQIEYNI